MARVRITDSGKAQVVVTVPAELQRQFGKTTLTRYVRDGETAEQIEAEMRASIAKAMGPRKLTVTISMTGDPEIRHQIEATLRQAIHVAGLGEVGYIDIKVSRRTPK